MAGKNEESNYQIEHNAEIHSPEGIYDVSVIEDMGDMQRSIYCGDVRSEHVGNQVTLMGWVNRRRDLGDLIFLDIRDRTGMVQVVCDKSRVYRAFQAAQSIRAEYVLCVLGTVAPRISGQVNAQMATGAVEVLADEIRILNTAKTPPFYIADEASADELLRMKYRYLDIRRRPLQKSLEMHHKTALSIRNYLSQEGYWEIETPMMTRSTPEGARDFLVPSRLEPGKFYALAQSPQLFKQLLMVGGVDKYYQIVKCFRDEDFRADRQPEFTQVDIELSFVTEELVWAMVEGLLKRVWQDVLGRELETPFPRLCYKEAMSRFGSDKPDTRFGMEIADVTRVFSQSGFVVFKSVIESGGVLKAICVPGQGGMSRQEIEHLTQRAKTYGAKGLVSIAFAQDGLRSPLKKHLTPQQIDELRFVTGAGDGDMVLLVADSFDNAVTVLGRLRLELGQRLGMIASDRQNFVWITEFPLFQKNEDTNEWEAAHHPFTCPYAEDIKKLFEPASQEQKGEIRARMYDLVLNGVELASGSIRIHKRELQERVFELLGLSPEDYREKFGFLLDAFQYGAPPHGGIAFGLDRLVMIMAGLDSIRDVIAFPKTASGSCPMTEAPAAVDEEQLKRVGLGLIKKT